MDTDRTQASPGGEGAIAYTARLHRARSGDRSALEELLVPELPRLLAYVRLRAGDKLASRETPEDLVQSVCREVVRDITSVKADSEEGFRAWLIGVAGNKLNAKRRFHEAAKRSKEQPGFWDDHTSVEPDELLGCYSLLVTPSREVAVEEELRRIESAFAALPENYRQVLLLVGVGGLSHEAAAGELGGTVESIKQLTYRARARFATLLDRGEHEAS